MNEKSWITITVSAPTEVSEDTWEIFLARIDMETESLGIEQPVAMTGDQPRIAVLYFPGELDSKDLCEQVQTIAHEALRTEQVIVSAEALADQDWGSSWREYFHWMRAGERIYVGPPWEAPPADAPADAILIKIEPAQAFGTGSHETTRLCLRAMESIPMEGETVLDMGAGSGILAIAAAKLGAVSVVGVEYDPVCEENFVFNAELNDCADRIYFVLGSAPAAGLEFAVQNGLREPGIALCNMLSERFSPHLKGLRDAAPKLLLSGWLWEELAVVQENVRAAGMKVEELFQEGTWGACLCTRI